MVVVTTRTASHIKRDGQELLLHHIQISKVASHGADGQVGNQNAKNWSSSHGNAIHCGNITNLQRNKYHRQHKGRDSQKPQLAQSKTNKQYWWGFFNAMDTVVGSKIRAQFASGCDPRNVVMEMGPMKMARTTRGFLWPAFLWPVSSVSWLLKKAANSNKHHNLSLDLHKSPGKITEINLPIYDVFFQWKNHKTATQVSVQVGSQRISMASDLFKSPARLKIAWVFMSMSVWWMQMRSVWTRSRPGPSQDHDRSHQQTLWHSDQGENWIP